MKLGAEAGPHYAIDSLTGSRRLGYLLTLYWQKSLSGAAVYKQTHDPPRNNDKHQYNLI